MIQIDQLVMRIPGISAEQGESLASEVGRRVAEALPDGMRNQRIPELKIRLTPPQVNGPASMAASIAEQIILQIKLAAL